MTTNAKFLPLALFVVLAGCPGVPTNTTTADKIPAGVYVGAATCTDSTGAETSTQAILRVGEDGWPLNADGTKLVLGTPFPLSSGGGFDFDGELTGLDVNGPKIVATWHYTATTTAVEGGEFTYVMISTSRLRPDGDVAMTTTQVGSGFDPSLNQYVTWNQDCSATLSQ